MLCFVCSQCSQATFSIYGDKGVQNRVSEIIQKHLNVMPQLNEEPCVICNECWAKLKDFHDYYEYVAEVHRVRVKILEDKIEIAQEDAKYNDYDQYELMDIKEECLDDQQQNKIEEIHFPKIQITEEQNPLQDQATENNVEDNLMIDVAKNRRLAIKNLKRTKEKKQLKKRRDRDFVEDSEKKSEALPPKRLKRIKDLKIVCEYEDTCKPLPKEDTKTAINTSQGQDFHKRPKRRIGHALLQENENLVKKHIKMSCEVCTDLCENFYDLIKHFRHNHPEVRPHIKCCERKLDCPSDILQHAHYHEDPEIFKCNECGKKFINKSGLRDHYMQYHEPEENLPFGCDQCPRRFSRRNLLEHHHAKHIPKTERSYFCDICEPKRAFANEYILQIHIRSRHTKDSNICHVCAKKIRDKQAFEKHVRLHFEESGPRIKCPRDGCDSWLKDKDNLKQHLRRFHDPQQYECPQCGRICKNKHSLTCHLKTTHSTKLYSCEECQKSFKSQLSLKEHMAGHSGEALYNCPFCSRTFNSKANMYSHKKRAHPKEWEHSHQRKKGSTKQQEDT